MANVKHIEIDNTVYDVVPSGSYVTGVKGSAESTYRTGNVNLSKTNVGLGNVPNVTTNNQTPTFSQASTRANIASGEKLSVLFSKIMKFFADLKTVAFTGAYSDLTDRPTIPTVGNGYMLFQKNGANIGAFRVNQSTDVTINIEVPTNTSQLTNDSNFVTKSGATYKDIQKTINANQQKGSVYKGSAAFDFRSYLNADFSNIVCCMIQFVNGATDGSQVLGYSLNFNSGNAYVDVISGISQNVTVTVRLFYHA